MRARGRGALRSESTAVPSDSASEWNTRASRLLIARTVPGSVDLEGFLISPLLLRLGLQLQESVATRGRHRECASVDADTKVAPTRAIWIFYPALHRAPPPIPASGQSSGSGFQMDSRFPSFGFPARSLSALLDCLSE
jgi:hypothetical protein